MKKPLLFLLVSSLAIHPQTEGKELVGTYLPTTNECPSPEGEK